MTEIRRGTIARTAEVWDNFRVGTTTGDGGATAPFPGEPLANQPTRCIEVTIQCDPGSPETLFVGNVYGQHRHVVAGAVEVLPVQDLSLVYVMSLGGTATFNWMAGE